MKLHFARFEFKYLLSEKVRMEVEKELNYFVELDPYAQTQSDETYLVRSLYYDDPFHTAFHDKIDGLLHRYKFRVRTYSNIEKNDIPKFLEIKGRYNNLVYKHRTIIDHKILNLQSATSKLADNILKNKKMNPVSAKFIYESYRKQLQPIALIDYNRRPYISKYDPQFRLTFDDRLKATFSKALFPTSLSRCCRIIPGYTIMEVKFRYHMPAWFHHILQYYELNKIPFSKIVNGMKILKIAKEA